MITIADKSTIAGLSELRTKSEKILKQLEDHKVILQKHNKPVAVMLAYKQYINLMNLLDMVENRTLGEIALKRDQKSTGKDFVDIDEW